MTFLRRLLKHQLQEEDSIMTEMEEFKKEVRGANKKRLHKVNNSFGTKDAFKYYRANRPKEHKYVLTPQQFLYIVRQVNNTLRELLASGQDVVFPERMGQLELRKRIPTSSFEDGKLKTNLPIDWDATLKLWYEDKESYDKKRLVRHESKEIFRVFYNKYNANYDNKSFYQFSTNRELKLRIKKGVQEERLSAFLINNKKYGTELSKHKSDS